MPSEFGTYSETLLEPLKQPQVFQLSQSSGLLPQSYLWGSAHEAPSTLGNCHLAISRALSGEQDNELSWWSGMLNSHLDQLVTGYMDGCRRAHHWNFVEVAQVHWHSFAVKMRLRAAKHFPRVWAGAGRSLNALQMIQAS